MKKTVALILSLIMVLTMGFPAFAAESNEEYHTVAVEYSDNVGKREPLRLMVKDGHVFTDAKALARRLGYTFEGDGDEAEGVSIRNTDPSNGIPYSSTIFHFGSTHIEHTVCGFLTDAYEAPFASVRNDEGVWVPLEYSLLLLNSGLMVADDTLLIDVPAKRIVDYFYDVAKNKQRYDFEWADDFGYTETDVGVLGSTSHLVNVFNGVLTLEGASWASLFQQFAGRMDSYDEKYGERLALLLCTESDKELQASIDKVNTLSNLLNEDGKLGEMLSGQDAMLESQVKNLSEICEKTLQRVRDGNSPLVSYNRSYKALEDALDKQTWFSKTGGNILETQRSLSHAAGSAFTILEVGAKVLEVVGYAREFQNQDEFSLAALAHYLDTADDGLGFPDKMRESMVSYTDALSDDLSGYMAKRLWDNIDSWIVDAAQDKVPLYKIIGMQAAGVLLAWNVASNTIPFIANGLEGADCFELALYSQVFQHHSYVNYSGKRNSAFSNGDFTAKTLYELSQYCYAYLKSCYVTRETALGSLVGKSESIKEKIQPLVDQQNKINEEIAKIMVEFKGASESNEECVYGFLPSDNVDYLSKYDDSILIGKMASLESSLGSQLQHVTDPRNLSDANDVDLGFANVNAAADDEYFYIGTGSNSQENGSLAKPRVLRVSKADTAKCEIIWEGTQANGTCTLRKTGDTIVVASSPWRGDIAITAMKKDGSDAKQIVDPGLAGRYYSNRIFETSADHVFYGAVIGNSWQVRSCRLDGSDDKVLCEGTSEKSTASIDILAHTNDRVYFGMAGPGSGSDVTTLVYCVPEDGGAQTEVLVAKGNGNLQVAGDRLYVTEDNKLVSYTLAGKDRKIVTTLPETVSNGWIWNLSASYAYVIGQANSYDDGGAFLIDLKTGDATKVGGMEQYANINMVDDLLIASLIDDSIEVWNQSLQKQSQIWPNPNAVKSPANASNMGNDGVDNNNRGDKETDYLGVYSLDLGSGASYSVVVTEQEGSVITFAIESMGRNYSPIYSTEFIQAEVVDGTADFAWSDSWTNSGTGHIQFEEGQLTISMVQTKTASYNRSTLSTEQTGDRVLPKVSDTPPDQEHMNASALQ